ncbi:MAG: SDR family NAD(P)-dependent oxidoreductase [Myxococcales bacterium]|nr:SDR family NAD(P)-dependent oxidoreductase [Myxococcales bacterium]
MGRLDGRVAIITGAGRGIGASLARSMATEGCAVVVNDLGVDVDGSGNDSGPAAGVVEEIVAAGGVAKANFADVSDFQAAEGIIESTLEEFGKLDVLVNVAGILRDRMVFNMGEEEWDAVIRVHLKGTFNTSKHASVYWRKERRGKYRVINFTSGSGLHGAPGQPNYAAAKLGIVGFTYSLANSLGPYGVTANAIAPGAATRMTATIPDAQRRKFGLTTDDPRRSPDNIAPPVIYLASEASDWLNGRVIGASGYRISLYNTPEVIREVASPTPWDLDDAFKLMEQSFRPVLEGRSVFGARKQKD